MKEQGFKPKKERQKAIFMSENNINLQAFKLIDAESYLKNERNMAVAENDDDKVNVESEKIDIKSIQKFVTLFNQQTNEELTESIIKYFFKQIFGDLNKFSNCNFNCVIISGLLIRANYLNDILILEYLQGLLKAKQLHKIKVLFHILQDKVDDEDVIMSDIKENILQILSRRNIELPLYPEDFEWKIIFDLVDAINKHVHAYSFTKDDLNTLETDFEEQVVKNPKEASSFIDDHYKHEEKAKVNKYIYQVIKSSGTSDEVVHKLLSNKENDSFTVISTILQICSKEKLYSRIYENILIKICEIGSIWETSLIKNFEVFYSVEIEDEEIYPDTFNIKHLSTLFAKLLANDSLDFKALKIIKINSRETTERKRVFLKYLFTELVSEMSLEKVKKILLLNKLLKPYYKDTLFPSIENPKDTIYSINFFTAIGLGELTVKMRKQMDTLKK